jgi:hypothetical protein
MRFDDLIDPERGPAALVKFALYPLIFLVVFSLVVTLLTQVRPLAALALFVLLLLLSPLAYIIRESRQGRPRGQRARGGAERTPLLPQDQEDQ